MKYIDKAIEILRRTDDGNRLTPMDLHMVQAAVNGWLSEAGEVAFNRLYRRVEIGYQPEWFHGIEHLLIDHEGYVRWRGAKIDHYNLPWAYSEEAKAQAQELASRCRKLEAAKRPVNTTTVVWQWEEDETK